MQSLICPCCSSRLLDPPLRLLLHLRDPPLLRLLDPLPRLLQHQRDLLLLPRPLQHQRDLLTLFRLLDPPPHLPLLQLDFLNYLPLLAHSIPLPL